jgi:uncharacterized protein DUF4440
MEKEIIALEKSFWQAIVDEDTDKAVSMIDKKSLLTGAQGVNALTPSDYRKMAQMSDWKVHSFDLSKINVVFPKPDVAVIGYEVHEDLTVQGERMTLDAADSSVWVKRDGEWLNVHHTESILGDPFGRDRKNGAESQIQAS